MLVFVADKFVLIKNKMYFGKRYFTNGLFKMNVLTFVQPINNNKVNLLILLSLNSWHGTL